jgi:ABC-type thiamin/hydroxymethylpyrimidine transport system permease subunit
MRFTVRDLVYIGVFGALWGAAEMTLGSLLHVLNVPFSGAVLAGIGITIALIGRLFVPRTGSVLFIGLVTALLKMLSLGGIVLNPMIGIVAESLLAEVVLSLWGQPRRASFVVAGGLAVFWPFVHPFFTQGILAGQGILTVYGWTLEKGANLLGLDPSALLLILGGLVGVHFLIGIIAGLLAWDAGRIVQLRLQPSPFPYREAR